MKRFKGSGALWAPHHPGGDSVPFADDLAIQVYGYFEGYSSIANVAREWSRVLAAKFSSIGLHNYAPGPAALDDTLQRLRRFDPYAPVGIYYGMPADILPMMVTNHQIVIGAFVCETDQIPKRWVEVANRFDLVVVPSRFCRDAFTRSGVTSPIVIIPHGLEPEYRRYKVRRNQSPFVFYNTFSASSFPVRKGCEELIRCFTKAFEGRDDVVLHLRTQDAGKIREWREAYDRSGLIKILRFEECDTAEYASFFSRAHCTVHPSKGEGFGLVPFQSIACETPVIAMPVSGMADYLTEENAMLLRNTGKVDGTGWGGQAGEYYGIDEEHLVELLQYAVDNHDQEQEKVSRAGRELRRQYTWETVMAPLVSAVGDIVSSESVEAGKNRLRERLQDMGCDLKRFPEKVTVNVTSSVGDARQAVKELFRHSYCITIDRHAQRWPLVEEQWRNHGIEGQFFHGVDLTLQPCPTQLKPDGQPLTPHAQAIIRNHLAVIQLAKDQGLPQVAVFEDDFIFTEEFSRFAEYLTDVPDDWDVIVLGGNWRIKDPDPVNERVVRVRRSWNAHAYVVRQPFYDQFLEFQQSMEWETDVYNGQMQDKGIGNWYGFYKDMCWQRGIDGGSVTMSLLHPDQVENFRRFLADNQVGFRFWWRFGGHLVEDYMRIFGNYRIDATVPDQLATIRQDEKASK